MNAYKIEAVLTEDGTLMLKDIPFHAGDAVEVIIMANKAVTSQQTVTIPQPEHNPYPLHNTQPYRYDDPTDPIALEDWEVLQ
jgi:hypothetical protein